GPSTWTDASLPKISDGWAISRRSCHSCPGSGKNAEPAGSIFGIRSSSGLQDRIRVSDLPRRDGSLGTWPIRPVPEATNYIRRRRFRSKGRRCHAEPAEDTQPDRRSRGNRRVRQDHQPPVPESGAWTLVAVRTVRRDDDDLAVEARASQPPG